MIPFPNVIGGILIGIVSDTWLAGGFLIDLNISCHINCFFFNQLFGIGK
ncbi:MAG: hypothetical protein LWW90_03235 [Candidatus Desulfofervidus auxilii]|nr:hypothetical protein [Candidatus Desulfofervidus auxilii]